MVDPDLFAYGSSEDYVDDGRMPTNIAFLFYNFVIGMSWVCACSAVWMGLSCARSCFATNDAHRLHKKQGAYADLI